MEDKMKTLQWNWEEALAAHELARSCMADRWKSFFTPFKKGDQVWLDLQNLKTVYHKNMKPEREGPFTITDALSPVTYQLKLTATWRIHNVFLLQISYFLLHHAVSSCFPSTFLIVTHAFLLRCSYCAILHNTCLPYFLPYALLPTTMSMPHVSLVYILDL